MPQLSKANVTPQRDKCHTSCSPNCGICFTEVWHLPYSAVAFALPKCGVFVCHLHLRNSSLFFFSVLLFSSLFFSYASEASFAYNCLLISEMYAKIAFLKMFGVLSELDHFPTIPSQIASQFEMFFDAKRCTSRR